LGIQYHEKKVTKEGIFQNCKNFHECFELYLEVCLQSIKSQEAFFKMEHPGLQAFLFFDMFGVIFFR
jgi:hypothetical protein